MPSKAEKKALRAIERLLGVELRQKPVLEGWRFGQSPAFTLGPEGNVTGLGIQQSKLSDLQPIAQLHNLQILDLRFSQVADLQPIAQLHNLQILDLRFSRVADLQPIAQLHNLQRLDLTSSRVADLQPIAQLHNLQNLDLRYSQVADLQPIAQLHNLQYLGLSYSQVADLRPIAHLAPPGGNLTWIEAPGCRITALPEEWLTGKTKLVWTDHFAHESINLYDNPLLYPPPEVIQQGPEAVASYAASLSGSKFPLNEARILLIGAGGSGKTTLVRRLLGEPFQEKSRATEGIRIRPWPATTDEQGDPVTAHLWDFGGQEILHATHQFFLSQRSLYIVVLDGRREERPEYWLRHVEAFGGNSPVLVVLNKQDEHERYDVDRKSLLRNFPNIVGFFPVSCKTEDDAGRSRLIDALTQELVRLPLLRVPFAENWMKVKSELASMGDPYINYDRYVALCDEHGIDDSIARSTLLEFLDQLGVVLYFGDLTLQDTHVLQPQWLTQGVYRILNAPAVKKSGGILDESMLTSIFSRQEEGDVSYSRTEQGFLLEMMERFELGYRLESPKKQWLLPDQLPIQEPESLPFDPGSPAQLYFEYSLLPPNLFVRFMVQRRQDITERWRTGLVLRDETHAVTAMVLEDSTERRISIWIEGRQIRDYLAVLRKTLEDLHKEFQKIDVGLWIPFPDQDGEAVEYAELVGLEEMGESQYTHGKSKSRYGVAKLLNSIEPPEDRVKQRVGRDGINVIVDVDVDNRPHFENKPQVNNTAEATSTSHAQATAQAFAQVQQQLQGFRGTFDVLREDLLDEIEDEGERRKLEKELDRVGEAIAQIESASAQDEVKPGAVRRLKQFVDKLGDATTRVGKAMQGVESMVNTTKALTGYAQPLFDLFATLLV